LIEDLPTVGDSVTVGALVQQDWARFKTTAPSVYGHFAQLMAMAPDITFAEFLGFVVEGNDATSLIGLGTKRLDAVTEGTDPDVLRHLRSDRFAPRG
jgi:hypothetical protein